MKAISYSSLSIALFATMFGSAAHSEISKWKDIGWWNISFYPANSGCSAYAEYEGGTHFFIGLEGEQNLYLRVMIFNDLWKSIEKEKEYDVEVTFGNETPWTLEMTGVELKSSSGLSFVIDAQSETAGLFVEEFSKEVNMQWQYLGKPLGLLLLLNNSRDAFREVVECTRSYKDAVEQISDPFAVGTGKSDPFQ